MSVVLQFSPRDHGRTVSAAELAAAEYFPGFKYEVIAGRLFVTPAADFHHDRFEKRLLRMLWDYADERPDVVGWVTDKARVFIPDVAQQTAPEPDLAIYRLPPSDEVQVHWRDLSPFVVVEIMAGGDDEKDLVRNVALYESVPSIAEYWVFDLRGGRLIVFERAADWKQREFIESQAFASNALPGLSLTADAKRV